MKKFPRDKAQIAFLDVLFNILLIVFLLVNPPKQEAQAKPIADYMLYVVWDTGRATDLDVYVQGPDRHVAWYRSKDIGYVSIDRDDLGHRRDSGPINQEIVSFRSPPDGSYFVSVHTYREEATGPGTVSLELVSRDGTANWQTQVPLPASNQENGVVEFVFEGGKLVKAYHSSQLIRFSGVPR